MASDLLSAAIKRNTSAFKKLTREMLRFVRSCKLWIVLDPKLKRREMYRRRYERRGQK